MNLVIPRIIQSKLDTDATKRAANKLRGRRNRAIGNAGESAIEWKLRGLGVQMVEKVNTPWRIKRVGGKIVGASPMAKVSGDYRGILPGGRSVLVEVKTVEHLMFSEFKPHQIKALDTHRLAGAASLIGWVCGSDTFVLEWPVPGFGSGTSLPIETARLLNVTRIGQ